MNYIHVEKFIDFLDFNLNKISKTLKSNIYFKYIRKYYPIILTFLFIIYIFWSLSSSNVDLQNIQNTKNFFYFIFISFSISPVFLILSSLRFHFMKILFRINTSFSKSLDSILIASSLDAFTPAKINDFARICDSDGSIHLINGCKKVLDILNRGLDHVKIAKSARNYLTEERFLETVFKNNS